MPAGNLATSLNDHLAGSVAAIELLEHLGAAHPDSELADFLAAIRADIRDDQRVLQELMDRLVVTASPVRRAAAWVAEKAVRVKLGLDGDASSDLRSWKRSRRSLWVSRASGRSGQRSPPHRRRCPNSGGRTTACSNVGRRNSGSGSSRCG